VAEEEKGFSIFGFKLDFKVLSLAGLITLSVGFNIFTGGIILNGGNSAELTRLTAKLQSTEDTVLSTIGTVKSTTDRITGQVQSLSVGLSNATGQLQSIGGNLTKLGTDLGSVKAGFDRLGQSSKGLDQSIQDFNRLNDQFDSLLKTSGRKD
jgi:hypothetical protein